MIAGIGIDIADIKRFRRSIEELGDHFTNRIYLPDEIRECQAQPDPYKAFAALFSVKEAVMKALGYGLNDGALFTEIEVSIDIGVSVKLYGRTSERASNLGVNIISAGVDFKGDFTVAAVILDGLKSV